MRVTKAVAADVRRLFYIEHWAVGTIAKQLKLHHDTVRRVLGIMPAAARPTRTRPAMCLVPYAGFIAQTLERYPTLTSTRLCDMLRERGFQASPRTVRRYVATVRPTPAVVPVLHITTLKGEQAQVDWAHVGQLAVPGGQRALWLFVMVLTWSRALWAEFVMDLSAHQVARSLLRASVAFGGATRTWLFDNAKTVVVARYGKVIRFHPALIELSGALHVEPRACAVRAPREKGSVERAVRYLRDRFLAARTISSIAQGNELLRRFIAETAHPRPHPVTRERTVQDAFEEERGVLLPLPNPLPPTDLVIPARIDRQGFFAFDSNRYSVPTMLAGRTLTLCADDLRLRVIDGDAVVAQWDRCYGRHQRLELPEHRAALVKERKAARAQKGRDRLGSEVPRTAELFSAWLAGGHNVGLCTIRTLKLLDLYGAEVLRAAVDDVLEKDIHDVGALAVRCDLIRAAHLRPVPVDLELPDHVQDKDVIPHDLKTYDGDDDGNDD